MRGTQSVTFEEGTCAAWLHDLLKPHVSRVVVCSGTTVYAAHRSEWLAKISEPGVRLRAERFYQQLDLLEPLRQAVRCEFVGESQKHSAVKLLRQIPSIGPIRAALLVALLQTPHRFVPSDSCGRTAGSPSKLTTAASTYVRGKLVHKRERISVRGLNGNYNRDLGQHPGRDHSAIPT